MCRHLSLSRFISVGARTKRFGRFAVRRAFLAHSSERVRQKMHTIPQKLRSAFLFGG
jgi:hypothetical protein